MRTRIAAACLFGIVLLSGRHDRTPLLAMTEQATAPAATRVFEMRTYYTHPGRLDALNKRFREHTTALFKKHGMENVGYWMPVDKPDVLVYILAHPSRQAADAAWKAFRDDPAWQKARAESEKDGPIVLKIESVFLSPTDYSAIK